MNASTFVAFLRPIRFVLVRSGLQFFKIDLHHNGCDLRCSLFFLEYIEQTIKLKSYRKTLIVNASEFSGELLHDFLNLAAMIVFFRLVRARRGECRLANAF